MKITKKNYKQVCKKRRNIINLMVFHTCTAATR